MIETNEYHYEFRTIINCCLFVLHVRKMGVHLLKYNYDVTLPYTATDLMRRPRYI